MPAKLEGKVAFITGAARARAVPYPMATPDDLTRTVKEVEALKRRVVATQADAGSLIK